MSSELNFLEKNRKRKMGSLTNFKNALHSSCKTNSNRGMGKKVVGTEFYTLINLEVHL